MEEESEISLSELDARASGNGKDKKETPQKIPCLEKREAKADLRKAIKDLPYEKTHDPKTGRILPIDQLPMLEKSAGGTHLKLIDPEEVLSAKDFEVLELLNLGVKPEAVAKIKHLNRNTVSKLLNSKRGRKFTEEARKRICALAPLAAELIHNELLNGNIELAQQVLKGLGVLKSKVDPERERGKVLSMAEEVVERGGRVTRRIRTRSIQE